MNTRDFVAAQGITSTAVLTDKNPNMTDPIKGGSHWIVTLTNKAGRTMAVPFSQGAAHRRWRESGRPTLVSVGTVGVVAPTDIRQKYPPVKGDFERESVDLAEYRKSCTEPTPPDCASVLDCLASDAASYDQSRDFDEWASDFGYDTDSRKAEKTYRVCGEQSKELRHFLGDAEYRALLGDVERL